jgi:hypothetical protein
MPTYSIQIMEDGRCKLSAQYIGSRSETICKNFSQAIALLETWYSEDKNLAQWGKN